MGRSLGNTGMARRAYFSLLLVYRRVIQEFYGSISITMFFWYGLRHAQSVDTRPFPPTKGPGDEAKYMHAQVLLTRV